MAPNRQLDAIPTAALVFDDAARVTVRMFLSGAHPVDGEAAVL